jgi:ACT domain-containing protein
MSSLEQLQSEKDKLQTEIDAINKLIAPGKNDNIKTLIHAREKLATNKKLVSLEIQIERCNIEIQRILKEHGAI